MVATLDRRHRGTEWASRRRRPDPVDAIVRTILSQNTSDSNRDLGYDGLRSRFQSWDQVRRARLGTIEAAIRRAGLAGQKARSIRGFLNWLHRERGELCLDFLEELSDEQAVEILIEQRGIGMKTAYILMAFAFGRDLCAVDTHVHRILKRVGVIDAFCGRDKAHTELRPLIPQGKAIAFHVNLLDHGKTVCTARAPDCGSCDIAPLCESRADQLDN